MLNTNIGGMIRQPVGRIMLLVFSYAQSHKYSIYFLNNSPTYCVCLCDCCWLRWLCFCIHTVCPRVQHSRLLTMNKWRLLAWAAHGAHFCSIPMLLCFFVCLFILHRSWGVPTGVYFHLSPPIGIVTNTPERHVHFYLSDCVVEISFM